MEAQNLKKQEQEGKSTSAASSPSRTAANSSAQSPPSPSSSPTHDFEFTISLCPSLSLDKHRPPSYEIDLCPADDLFYQGHLLPLHYHHLFSTPRSSCTSKDESSHHHHDHRPQQPCHQESMDQNDKKSSAEGRSSSEDAENSRKTKQKSFSLFTLKKGSKLGLRSAKEVIERYVRMVKPFFARKSKEAEDQRFGYYGRNRQKWSGHASQSFSNQRCRSSAPCSTMTSPGNSGILCAIPSSSDSTMEDLQNAIQAAIAHCKNSIAIKEEKS
uniref:BRI1 kinase inhibitor 1 n=2 Tax=Nymphaea colorata TaxID=210225 RepID=A0A5K1FLK3_9MAGN